MSKLVIVESPAKAKTINKILGKEYSVKASVGHVKDLPKKALGVHVEQDFAADYEVIKGKEKIIRELRSAAKKADTVYLAPDPDREGEAIAYHIATELTGGKDPSLDDKLYRVAFNEITKKAVQEAIEHPGKLNMHKVDAQQARRILDRLVGYGLSPLLWRKVRRGLSAGRVQSVAVKLTVDREREIQAFNREEYWSVTANFLGEAPPPFDARLFKYDSTEIINRDAPEGKRFFITNEESAQSVVKDLEGKNYEIRKIDKKTRKRSPAAPFITSTLQQEAFRKLRFTGKRTMMIAQQLYEGIELGGEGPVGLITYMRTDSVRVADEAQQWAREFISGKFGGQYVPEKPPFYKSKKSAQEAHEAIRPTYGDHPPEAVSKFLGRDQLRLYKLIWNRFIASQMRPAELEQTTMEIFSSDDRAHMRASGSVIKFDGFMALYTEDRDDAQDEDKTAILPALKEGQALTLNGLTPNQHFTQPPPRYTEATLVKALEEKGVGRPSTYAAIISTIKDRKYIEMDERRLVPTELGMVVNDLLVERFPELIDMDFTAKLETDLDRVESGSMDWVKVVRGFYEPFNKDLEEAGKISGKVKPEDIPTEEKCDKCDSDMVIRWGRHGRFMACSAYPECKNTRPLEDEKSGSSAPQNVPTDEKCPKCGTDMVLKSGRFGKFMACSAYPECKTTKPIPTGVKCPEDGGDLVERRSKKGKKFWSCANYPNCKYASWSEPYPKPCPSCKAPFLLKKWEKTGDFTLFCGNKECGHSEKLETPEE